MSISFGPGGNSISFGKKKFPEDLPEYLDFFHLNGYEIECGRGVRIAKKTYELLPAIAKEHNICLSIHAPYYISLSSVDEEIRMKSLMYIYQTARAAKALGAEKIVVHSGSCGKMSREEALLLAKDTLIKAQAYLDEEDLGDIIICPETMGKINQLGTLEEVLELCSLDERLLPCVDFGHLNARTFGGIKAEANYAAILDAIENKLGVWRLKQMHMHFSKIHYTDGGEKVHLNFSDSEAEKYGPPFEPLMNQIAKRGMEPSVICESAGMQAEDASQMVQYFTGI